jgi:Arc/MetJ-type ribon-helix-helix transcriptional regulator
MGRMTRRTRALRETLAPYGESSSPGGTTKLSISLPTDLVDAIRDTARDSGSTVSAVIAAALRRTLEHAEQADIDRALDAQAQENLEWAEAYVPIAAKLWSELEW